MQKILIVEDEMAYLKLLSSHFTKAGYTIVEAVNGKKGLEVAKREKPDLILLDIRMPEMDGMTMLKQLRSQEVGKKTKVVLLTNLEPDDKVIKEVVEEQPSYYFIKSDIKLDDLLEKIKELLAE